MKKLIIKMEIRKFNKICNNSNVVMFTDNNMLVYAYNKITKKRYYPKHLLRVGY